MILQNLTNRRDFFRATALGMAGASLPQAFAAIQLPTDHGSLFGRTFGKIDRRTVADASQQLPLVTESAQPNVHISVLSCHQTDEFTLRPVAGGELVVEANIGPHGELAILKNDNASLHVTGPTKATGHYGRPARFILGVPGHDEREYFGRLEIRPHGSHLIALVEMDIETAVASIVNGEGTEGLPIEARRAQAVATRSYLLAAKGLRHSGFDFCDQEHCQYLLSAPEPASASAKAAVSTHGQVLTYKGKVVAALYSANCGGHTRTLHQAGWQDLAPHGENYPFFGVSCPLQGPVNGHRVGMCQSGAIEIARNGKEANDILSYYFPNTSLGRVQFTAGKGARAAT